jgi:hypothetical protein
MIAHGFPKYLVPRLKVPDIFANQVNAPGDVRAQDRVARFAQSPRAAGDATAACYREDQQAYELPSDRERLSSRAAV